MTDLQNRPDTLDAEQVEILPDQLGPVVDLPPARTTFQDLMLRADERRPIVPASLRSTAGRHALLVHLVAAATHGTAFHALRVPLYLGRIAWRAPVGLAKLAWKSLLWASAEEGNRHLRQQAASRGDIDAWLKLDSHRAKSAGARWWTFGAGTLATGGASGGIALAAPASVQALALAVTLISLAKAGTRADKHLLERAINSGRFVRLTADLTREALVASGSGIKDGSKVKFTKEIYRDGPGYTAEVALPTGVIAADVIDRRDYLSAGFQLPEAQVWPEPVRGAHPGILAIWVADRPVDRMRQPASPLLTSGPLDYWGPLPYGRDVRMRPVNWRLDERNSLFGGMPGSGKTLAARNVALALSLDPIARFLISELKGSGDFDAFEPLCGPGMYASGADDASKVRTLEMLRWLSDECERRGPAIRKWAAKGLNSQNKLNRAIAEADPSLFPLLAILDEIQELITDPDHGKEAKALGTSIVKRGRSLGIHVIFATQRIDKESVPKGITSNVSNRLALAVPSHVEVDLILGTGAYHRGARPTTFVPPADGVNPWAGWGYLGGRDQPIRADYIDNPTAEAIVQRALALRGDAPAPGREEQPDQDVLADIIRVFAHVGRPGVQWQQLAELLAAEHPGLYAGVTPDAVSAMARAAGVQSVDVKTAGVVLKGCRLDAVRAAHDRLMLRG